MKVEQILNSKGHDVITVPATISVEEAVSIICKRRIGAVVVVAKDDGPIGMFSERDLIHALHEKGAGVLELPVRAVMTELVHTCTSQATADEVMGMMTRRRIRHVPIVEDGEIKGLVSIGDLVKARISAVENEANALKEYIATG